MEEEIKIITRDELRSIVCSGEEYLLVDVLPEESYRNEHLPSAVSIPLDTLRGKIGTLAEKDDRIIVYCGSFECQASTKAARILMMMGYENVLVYKGGLKDFKEGGLPLEGASHITSSRPPLCEACCC